MVLNSSIKSIASDGRPFRFVWKKPIVGSRLHIMIAVNTDWQSSVYPRLSIELIGSFGGRFWRRAIVNSGSPANDEKNESNQKCEKKNEEETEGEK